MISKTLVTLFALTLFVGGLVVVSAQQGEDVRGAFLSSRPKTTNANAPRRRRPPRRANNASSSTSENSTVANANNKFANANTTSASRNANISSTKNANTASATEAIGLGYTLFLRDVNGRAVRVEPTREFHNGDRIRISLEPNIDGYLYVFHTEGDGAPEMIFPDSRLEGGDNWVAHTFPIDVPSTVETDERLRWFQFYGNPATEHLFVVVTREPLAKIGRASCRERV